MNVILAHWKDGTTSIYSSLVSFCGHHPQYKYERLVYYLTRKKVNFEDDWVIVEKKHIQKGVQKFPCAGCKIPAECIDLEYCPKKAGDK